MLTTDQEGQQPTLPFEPKDIQPKDIQMDWRSQVPSVSELTRKIRGQLENSFFDVWVKGEISNFRKPASGHAYFNLKDATAQMRAVLFKGQLQKLKFELKDGMEILLNGRITVYEQRGDYQMVASTAEPVGAGALQLAFEQLKKKLQAEGLFDPKHKKRLPFLPKRIGIVTSSTGAAVRDILKVLGRRFPNLHVIIFPAAVQGDKAAADIVKAIESAETWNRLYSDRPIDVMIVGRGGGSIEDLWPFNEEIVARKIFACEIPIISAVGHEIDFTIADFVADLRAPTPSAAAEIVVPNRADLVFQVESYQNRLRSIFRRQLDQLRLHLGHLSNRLVDPRSRLKEIRNRLSVLEARLLQAMRNRMRFAKQKLESRCSMLDSLSPLKVLQRGYSITSNDEGILRSRKGLKAGDTLTTLFSDGKVESEIRAIID